MTNGQLYILLYPETSLFLVGPFASQAEAVRFGRQWQAACDDPRWQLMQLTDEALNGLRPTAPADITLVRAAIAGLSHGAA